MIDLKRGLTLGVKVTVALYLVEFTDDNLQLLSASSPAEELGPDC